MRWITDPPEFSLDGEGVVVRLISKAEPDIFIRLSRHECRMAAVRIGRLLDDAEREQHARVSKLCEGGH